MTLINFKLNKFNLIVLFIATSFSSCQDKTIKETIISETCKMVNQTSQLKSKNIIYLYRDSRDNDSIIGIAYGLPTYEKNKYYFKGVKNKAMLIEKSIYNNYFLTEKLKICNESKYFKSNDYFPIVMEPYFINIFIKKGKVEKIERHNIPNNSDL